MFKIIQKIKNCVDDINSKISVLENKQNTGLDKMIADHNKIKNDIDIVKQFANKIDKIANYLDNNSQSLNKNDTIINMLTDFMNSFECFKQTIEENINNHFNSVEEYMRESLTTFIHNAVTNSNEILKQEIFDSINNSKQEILDNLNRIETKKGKR